MCSSNEASELLTHLSTAANSVAANSCLAIQPGWGRIASARLSASPPLRQSHTPINNLYREVFLSFQYSCPNGILRAIFVEPKRKKNVFNYLFPEVLALPDWFFLFSLSLSLLLLPPGPWLDGAPLSKHCISPDYPTGKFVWSHHIYRLMRWACLALYYLVLWTRALSDRGTGYGSPVHPAEQRLWSLMWSRKSLVSQCLFSQLC